MSPQRLDLITYLHCSKLSPKLHCSYWDGIHVYSSNEVLACTVVPSQIHESKWVDDDCSMMIFPEIIIVSRMQWQVPRTKQETVAQYKQLTKPKCCQFLFTVLYTYQSYLCTSLEHFMMYVYVCVHLCVCVCVFFVCMYVYVCMCVCVCLCMFVCVCVQIVQDKAPKKPVVMCTLPDNRPRNRYANIQCCEWGAKTLYTRTYTHTHTHTHTLQVGSQRVNWIRLTQQGVKPPSNFTSFLAPFQVQSVVWLVVQFQYVLQTRTCIILYV